MFTYIQNEKDLLQKIEELSSKNFHEVKFLKIDNFQMLENLLYKNNAILTRFKQLTSAQIPYIKDITPQQIVDNIANIFYNVHFVDIMQKIEIERIQIENLNILKELELDTNQQAPKKLKKL